VKNIQPSGKGVFIRIAIGTGEDMHKNDVTIKTLVSPPKDTNVYVIACGGEAAVVDAADCCDVLQGFLKEMGTTLKYLLLTHGHSSHVSSLSRIKKKMGGTICMHPSDQDLLRRQEEGLEPDRLLADGQPLKLAEATIKVLHTPGHTPGSLCYHLRETGALFTGDTLLKGEFGKIRGPHSMGLMLRSLKRLNSVIPPKTTVYPGHGPMTTMSKEAWLDTLDNLS
jgi:glyoxylase-like metal-dependent hydrolase (beta-lactamase superfamily II)